MRIGFLHSVTTVDVKSMMERITTKSMVTVFTRIVSMSTSVNYTPIAKGKQTAVNYVRLADPKKGKEQHHEQIFDKHTADARE